MRIAVYDQYWATAGGGEKFAGGIAEVLSRRHDVSLLVHHDLDLVDLGERLQLDLGRVRTEHIAENSAAVHRASTGYDLLVNASYMSSAVCGADAGIYVVHFPHHPGTPPRGLRPLAKQTLRQVLGSMPGEVEYGEGFHAEEYVGRRRVRWTTGHAEALVTVARGDEVEVQVLLSRSIPREVGSVPVHIAVDDVPAAEIEIRSTDSRLESTVAPVRFRVVGRGDHQPVSIRIASPAFVPADRFGGDDDRVLGVPVAGIDLGDRRRAGLRRWLPAVVPAPGPMEWIDSYDSVVSNSEYTRGFVRRWWGVTSGLLNPPVTLQPAGEKRPVILSVGRFFDAESGHSKKQLEMVGAFARLIDDGLEGWQLHLVGGCSRADRVYLERVRHAARGLPVEFHINAPGAELRSLYAAASIYWHASGLGEDPDRHPDRFEHFGITTVEAMSAGAVPIVIGHAGQLEVVEHGQEGYHWRSLDELVSFTEAVIGDDQLRARLGLAARRRAERYGMEAFAQRLEALVESTVALSGTTAGAHFSSSGT